MSKALRKNDVKILNDIEHCLLRPGMYIGSPKEELIQSYIYEDNKIVQKEIPQIPGLLKLFDEIVKRKQPLFCRQGIVPRWNVEIPNW
mgnify:CR=1 FL=1